MTTNLNNNGIAMLGKNRRSEACQLFKTALGVLTDQKDLLAQATVAVVEDLHLPASELPFIPVSMPSLSWSYSADCASQSNFYYSKAFLFNPRLELDQSYECSLQAVIIFNIALVYHTTAVNPHDEFEATALALYDNCLELLDQDGLEDLSYIRIAALNNKIQIHHGRADPSATSFFLGHLGKILKDTMQRRDANYFDNQELNGLLLNVACQRALICAPGA